MPRNYRACYPGSKFHITSRGIRRSVLFYEDDDYSKYLRLLSETKEKLPFILHAYCLMPNHVHLLLEIVEDSTGAIIKQLHYRYARYFNKKYEFTGHLFESRYGREWIDSSKYELDASKYIHRNPLKAQLVNKPQDYNWSSYKTYYYNLQNPLIQTHQILSHFENPQSINYDNYINSPVSAADLHKENQR
ncbi:transposase [Bacillus infantis]|uniref:transposase n=1 Tax=Bacillus infantis TaxID=324767 RepID=UPI003CFA5E0F